MSIKEELHRKSQTTNNDLFDFTFKSNALNYRSLLKGFNKVIQVVN